MADIKIPIDTIKDNFSEFLNTENNARIFFSGKFGIGKTYFLNDFFSTRKDEYEVFYLCPINYQINNNEDIIELIKYDILVELLKKNPEILQENNIKGISDSALLFYSWCKQRFSLNSILQSTLSISESANELLVDPVLSLLGKLGRPLKDLLEIDKEFQEFKNDYKKGEKGKAEKYIQAIKEKNISETDYISYLLKEKITQQKKDKKSILVLDDLDRIDPEHIFRILNILSAYFEKEHENKFGFDKIIIVADYSNIKSIFHHKYGLRTDFSGYTDKFFTINPYYFDNKKAILDTIDEISKNIKNEEPGLNSSIGDSGYIKLFLRHIFTKTIDAEIINLRQLLKSTKFLLSEFKKGSYYEDHFSSDSFKQIMDKAIKTTIISFSSTEVFIEKIETIKLLPTNEKGAMPYGRYIQSMLKSFKLEIPKDDKEAIVWKKYTIRADKNGFDFVDVDGEKSLKEDLFYDLLIEYVKNKKYLVSSRYD